MRDPSRSQRGFVALFVPALVAIGLARPVHAQLLPDIDGYAEAIATLTTRRWGGPRVPWPVEQVRPGDDGPVEQAQRSPLTVHGGPTVEPELVEQTLAEVEAMRLFLDAAGWPAPPADGGAGGSSDFDLYLVPGLGRPYEARSDGPVPWSYLDAVTAHAVVDASMPAPRVTACAAEAYAAALLLTLDPAEAPAFRAATATYLGFARTGRFDGCHDDVAGQQREPYRAYVEHEEPENGGGALLLAMLDARHDGTGTFVRELWTMARQRTWEGDALRAAPDLWMALDHALELAGIGLLPTMTDFAVARYFLGREERERGLAFPTLRGLGSDAAVPLAGNVALANLPAQLSVSEPTLRPFGSAYARVDVRGRAPRSRLRIWMRGEYGVRWGLVAVGLDANGRERGRVFAPPRPQNPDSYIPYEIPDEVTDVLVIVVNLSNRVPDADTRDENDRRFFLILDDESD